ncbi:MAG: DMT family transporter [Betaproteobacteria bacterium]|nr:DMT family transporter [Betaproteobacteria bacterium]
MFLGLLGVVAFSLTLPATRAAVAVFDPWFVGVARGVVAGGLGALYLLLGRNRLPTAAEFRRLLAISVCVAVGFPLLSALAMVQVGASQGSVTLGLLPLATAVAATLLAHERPSLGFWRMAALGSALVVGYSLIRGGGALHAADLVLFAAVVVSAVGYALGAMLAPALGGLAVISWALVLAAPFLLLPAWLLLPTPLPPPSGGWAGLVYVCVISQFLGFLPWYRALALGGIARVGQIQLLQPFLTIAAAWALLGEALDPLTLGFALAVVAVVVLGRRFAVMRRRPS